MAPGTASGTVARHGVTVVVMAVGGIVTVVGSLLPWVRTGRRQRNSYDVFALAQRLGFSPDGPAANGLRWWPLVPLLVAAAVVVAWWGWRRPGGVVGVIAALYAGGIGVAVATADTAAVVEVRPGPAVTALGAAVLLAGAVATLVVSPPGRPTGPAR